MAGIQCPSCGLWNPPDSLDCYCGRPCVEGTTNRSREQGTTNRSREQPRPASWLVGLWLFVGGSAVTILSRGTAGILVDGLAGGAMTVGLIWMIARAATSARRLRPEKADGPEGRAMVLAFEDIIARNAATPRPADRRRTRMAAAIVGALGIAIAAWLVLKRPAAPNGTVFDCQGKRVDLSTLWSDHRVVVAFYPTLTCDDCRLGLENLNKAVIDATVIAISAGQDQLKEKREQLGLAFDVYADPSGAVSRAWGIPDLMPNTPMPAIFIVERGGAISYRKICDGTTRCPEMTDLRAALSR